MSLRTDRSITAAALIAAAALVATVVPAAATHDDPDSPDDPLFAEQWGPQQVRAEGAWDTTTGLGSMIGIVDSGIDLDHPDLGANVLPGATFIAACEQQGTSCGDGDWESGEDAGDPHGTHVAGIAAAVTDNGVGIAGVAPDASLLAVKALDSSGSGSFDDVAAGIRFATDQGANVINLSLGAPPGAQALVITGLMSQVLEAIEYANANGVVVVAAAGNEAFPICDEPAFDPEVICTGSTDRREVKSWFGNFPNKADQLGVSAPGGAGVLVACGEEVLSTVPPGEGSTACDYPEDEAYDEFFGTSMAAPHVSGVVGLLASLGCERADTIDIVTSTARDPGEGGERGTWDPVYGFGIVDAEAAVAMATEVCAAALSFPPEEDPADDGEEGDEGESEEPGDDESEEPGDDESEEPDEGESEEPDEDESEEPDEDESEEDDEGDEEEEEEDDDEEEDDEEDDEEDEDDDRAPGLRARLWLR